MIVFTFCRGVSWASTACTPSVVGRGEQPVLSALPYAALCLGQTAVSSLQQRSSGSAELEQRRTAGWEGSRASSWGPGWSGEGQAPNRRQGHCSFVADNGLPVTECRPFRPISSTRAHKLNGAVVKRRDSLFLADGSKSQS